MHCVRLDWKPCLPRELPLSNLWMLRETLHHCFSSHKTPSLLEQPCATWQDPSFIWRTVDVDFIIIILVFITCLFWYHFKTTETVERKNAPLFTRFTNGAYLPHVSFAFYLFPRAHTHILFFPAPVKTKRPPYQSSFPLKEGVSSGYFLEAKPFLLHSHSAVTREKNLALTLCIT